MENPIKLDDLEVPPFMETHFLTIDQPFPNHFLTIVERYPHLWKPPYEFPLIFFDDQLINPQNFCLWPGADRPIWSTTWLRGRSAPSLDTLHVLLLVGRNIGPHIIYLTHSLCPFIQAYESNDSTDPKISFQVQMGLK